MSFTWNSINCETLGLTVEYYPNRPIPKRKIATYSILGRSGDLIVDYDSYENVIQEYAVFVKGDAGNTMQENITAIAAWLAGTKGYKRLTDTYDTAIYREARVANAGEFINALNRFGRGVIQFDCKPQRKPLTENALTGVIGDTFTIPSTGAQPGFPFMSIETIGANTSFTIEDTNGLRIVVPARGNSIALVEIDWYNQTILNKFNDSVPSNTSITGQWKPLGDGDQIVTTLDTSPTPTVKMLPRRFFI